MGTEGGVEVRIEPATGRFDHLDDRWATQVDALVGELASEVGTVTRRHEPVAGTKGGVGEIVLAVTSGGVLTASIELLRSWVGRDRTRSVTVSWSESGRLSSVQLTGDATDPVDLHRLARLVSEAGGT
jgi:hypothetical protein